MKLENVAEAQRLVTMLSDVRNASDRFITLCAKLELDEVFQVLVEDYSANNKGHVPIPVTEEVGRVVNVAFCQRMRDLRKRLADLGVEA